jgi:hypothetical protein
MKKLRRTAQTYILFEVEPEFILSFYELVLKSIMDSLKGMAMRINPITQD